MWDGEIVVADNVADLVRAFQGDEQAKRAHHRTKTARGKPGRDINHVGFGHSDVEKTVRVALAEHPRPRARTSLG